MAVTIELHTYMSESTISKRSDRSLTHWGPEISQHHHHHHHHPHCLQHIHLQGIKNMWTQLQLHALERKAVQCDTCRAYLYL